MRSSDVACPLYSNQLHFLGEQLLLQFVYAKLSINLPLSFPPTISARQTATRHATLSNFLKNSSYYIHYLV